MTEAANSVERPKKYRRVKTPTMIQMEATECGAVALGIVMGYYGKFVPIEELRIACSISRNGSNAYNMTLAAANYQLDAKGYSLDLPALYEIELPAILYWKFDHFVVLEGFGRDCVYINDPATGPRTISYDDLNQSFTGVAIVVLPTKEFIKSGKPPSVLKALWKRSKNVKLPLLYATLVGLCIVVPNLAFPAFTQVFIDQVFINHRFDWQYGLIVGMALAIVGSSLLSYLQGMVLNRLQTRMSMQFASDSFWHMLRLPMSFYLQRYPGEIAYRLTLNDSISHAIAGALAPNLINVCFVLIYGIAILYYDAVIGLTAMAVLAISLLCMRLVYRSRTDAYARYEADIGKSTAYSLGALQNIETIKASGLEIKFFSTWTGYFTKVVNTLQEVGKRDITLNVITPLLSSLAFLVLVGVGGWRIMHGQLTIGMFLAVQILLNYFTGPVIRLAGFNQSLQLLGVDMARLDDLMQQKIDPIYTQPQTTTGTTKLTGHVEVQGVSFKFSPLDEFVVSDITFSLHPGKSVALVGPTGCGKSTIAKIIAGLLTPSEGSILFDGIPRNQIPRQRMVQSLSLVEQETFLFNGTLKDNLTLLDATVEPANIYRATQDACIHDDIISRIGGYDLEVQENGGNLSGGEKQRIEIARALIKNPSILVMDEATSALDSTTEEKILQNIRRRGCALLLITHRLSTISKCDEIIVIDQGKIVARGSHEELKSLPGLYHTLLESH